MPSHPVDIISEMYTNTWCQIKTTKGTSEEFEVDSVVRWGCALSPLLFICFMDKALREALRMTPGGWKVEYTTTEGLFLTCRGRHHAPQTSRTSSMLMTLPKCRICSELQAMVDALGRVCTQWGLKSMTKIMTVSKEAEDQPIITLKGSSLEVVESFPIWEVKW